MRSSAWLRRLTQLAFVLLTIVAVFALRANAERWCPFGGVEAFYSYFVSEQGDMPCSLGVSNFYILAAVLAMTLLVRRAFCGYVCPIGTISQWLRKAAASCKVAKWKVSRRLDRGLSLLKYPVLAVVLYFTYKAGELVFRGYDPCYVLLSRHGEDITIWAYVLTGALVLASLVLTMPFCRWLCPLAAVLNPIATFGVARVRRDPAACIECKKCDKVCPMAISVASMDAVTSARCISCLRCVEACPDVADGALSWGPPKRLGRAWPEWLVVATIVGCVATAVAASYAYPLPSYVRTRGEVASATSRLELRVTGVNCRGSATRLWETRLIRTDFLGIDGPLRLEAWPGPGPARVEIWYDPSRTDAATIESAITEPVFDQRSGAWQTYPFEIAQPKE